MAVEVDIAIEGVGLGRLALALGLQERGIRAQLFEMAPKGRVHSGTGISLAQNGGGLTLWQVRVPDENGEITKAYVSDLESHGQAVRKVRSLKQVEGTEDLENMKVAIEALIPIPFENQPVTDFLSHAGVIRASAYCSLMMLHMGCIQARERALEQPLKIFIRSS